MTEDLEGRVEFYKIEVGPNREFLVELGVSGLPTFLFYRNGQEKSSLAGTNVLLEEIKEHTERLLES